MPQVRIITLNQGDHLKSVLNRVNKGWTIHFILGPTLMGHHVRLFTTHPPALQNGNSNSNDDGDDEYYELNWVQGSKVSNDDMSAYAQVICEKAGAFSYFFLTDHSDTQNPNGSGHFLVAPILSLRDGQELPLDAVQCVTHLAKLLGPFPEWEGRLRVAKESGYNMIHLTPVQELGISNSSYSISDHLKLNPNFNTEKEQFSIADLKKLTDKMDMEWGMLTIQDVVWNHAAKNAPWLKEHPECAYNCDNSPHLRPAYVIDRVYHHFSKEIAAGKWEHRGLPAAINNENHLNILRDILTHEILPRARLADFFQVDVDKMCAEFEARIKKTEASAGSQGGGGELTIVQDPEYRRFGNTINFRLALLVYNNPRPECHSEEDRVRACVDAFRHRLYELNEAGGHTAWNTCLTGINAAIGHVAYERVAPHGLRRQVVCDEFPLLTSYFLHYGEDSTLEEEEKLMYDPKSAAHLMAFNGWVMCDDPLNNFAESPSTVYLARQLICWGDCVKLRYGATEKDCPYLWQHMTEYAKTCAQVFHGLRLDNCHSTPIHVARRLLKAARDVRPDLYVVAELFTGSEDIDNIFVNQLGITSLIREAQSAGDAHEEGRLVYRYGGEPVGAFIQRSTRLMQPSIAHAMFLDVTHDNPCPIQTRTVYDLLPSAALVAMACCATGSTRGYDELVPYAVNVVHEERLYTTWAEKSCPENGLVSDEDGIIAGKRAINKLHCELGLKGFTQVFVDDRTPDIVAVTRHNPNSHETVILVARTAFSPDRLNTSFTLIPPTKVEGVIEEVIFEMKLVKREGSPNSRRNSGGGRPKGRKTPGSEQFITGLSDYSVKIRENFKIMLSDMAEVSQMDGILSDSFEIEFKNFPPGSVIAFRVSSTPAARASISIMRQSLTLFGFKMRSMSGSNRKLSIRDSGLRGILSQMSLSALNRALFRCHEEEASEFQGNGAYDIPRFGRFVFCGIQGMMPLLNDIRANNDLGHPLCDNLRRGVWLADYIAKRLQRHPSTKDLGLWFEQLFKALEQVPHYLRPCYFDAALCGAYTLVREAVWMKMNEFVQGGSDFLRALALATVAFVGDCPSAKLPALSKNIAAPPPPDYLDMESGNRIPCPSSLSAGLPHFSHGIWRNWGRDTFIALPGCLLIPGRFDDARYIILAFAGALRHGLIPNLLGEGVCSRYNCRDAVWFWLLAIKQYVEMAPNGLAILDDKVRRIYPKDDTILGAEEREEPLHATMYEALQRHFAGISFRERDAGSKIDEHMTSEGFNVNAYVDLATGFVMGGNRWNCGTWMDKMGSSDRAGNRGQPATPRDGAAVELQGLCYAVVNWLDGLSSKQHDHFPYSKVVHEFPYEDHRDDKEQQLSIEWTWREWADRLKENFGRYFFIPESQDKIDEAYHPHPEMINHRGIVKDTYNSALIYADYQLRPNFPITLAVAPELLDPEQAWQALAFAENALQGNWGMKTLDPTLVPFFSVKRFILYFFSDLAYDGYYDNSDDSTDKKKAKGWNYHQGPEWLWVSGYFLRAQLAVAWRLRESRGEVWEETLSKVKHKLGAFWVYLQKSPWRSLPELTNLGGAECSGSCPAQAWSVSCILETVADLDRYGQMS